MQTQTQHNSKDLRSHEEPAARTQTSSNPMLLMVEYTNQK